MQEFEEAHNRAEEYLDQRRKEESSKTAGSDNPREFRKEAKCDSSNFHNDAERQE